MNLISQRLSFVIYMAEFPNGKKYIGKTCDIQKRIYQHKSDLKRSTAKFHNALRKYGYDNVVFSIIFESNDEIEIYDIERFYIRWYNTTDDRYGYNMTTGGEGINKGYKNTDIFKEKRSEYMIKHNPMKNKFHTKTTKDKIRKKALERYKNHKHPWKGRHHSLESRKKNAESNKKLYENGYVNPWKGRKRSAEQKKQISETLTGYKHPKVCCLICRKEIASNRINYHIKQLH